MKSFLLFSSFVLLAGICPLSALFQGAAVPTAPEITLDDPADTTQAFFEEVFSSEGDLERYICDGAAEAAEGMKAGLDSMQSTLASSGATLDISGLTYTTIEESENSATVEVAGKLKVTVSGVSQEVDFPPSPVKLVREDGVWKICG